MRRPLPRLGGADMGWIERLFLGFEYRWHRVDEYLASARGDMIVAADCAARAEECQRRLDVISVNRRFRHG